MRYILSIQHICVFLIVAVLLLPFTVSFPQPFPDQSWHHTPPDSVGMDQEGKRKWPDAPLKTFAASGFNNNDNFIIPEWDIVIVRLGLDQNEKWISDSEYNHFLGLVGNAIR